MLIPGSGNRGAPIFTNRDEDLTGFSSLAFGALLSSGQRRSVRESLAGLNYFAGSSTQFTSFTSARITWSGF
jgi:hypothetical protein